MTVFSTCTSMEMGELLTPISMSCGYLYDGLIGPAAKGFGRGARGMPFGPRDLERDLERDLDRSPLAEDPVRSVVRSYNEVTVAQVRTSLGSREVA
jgi:hypothetical protein